MKWHNPGLGKVHDEYHSQMIYCEDVDGIVDDVLAKEVCDMLNSKAQPAVEPVAGTRWRERWYGSGGNEGYEGWSIVQGRELIAHLGRNVSSDAVRDIVAAHNAPAPAPNALDAETAIKNCLEVGETMRVLKRVVNLLLESRRNLGPEDHELRDRIDQLFRPDAAIAAQSAQGKEGQE